MHYDPYLAHYGVKGMKWGVRRQRRKASALKDRNAWREKSRSERKKTRDQPNKRYTKNDRYWDETTYGKKGVKRINRRMNKGQTHGQAERREVARQAATAIVLSQVSVAAIGLYGMGPSGRRKLASSLNNYAKMGVQSFINNAKAENAARQARKNIPRLVANVAQNNTIKLKPWQYKVR